MGNSVLGRRKSKGKCFEVGVCLVWYGNIKLKVMDNVFNFMEYRVWLGR